MPGSAEETLLVENEEFGLVGEQLQGICRSQLASVPANFVLAIGLTFIVRGHVDHSILGIWLATILALNMTRLIVVFKHQRKVSDPHLTRRILLVHGISAFLAGLVWAAVPIFMFSLNNPSAPLVIFILCGITAGASVMASTYAMCAIAFIFPILTSMVFKLAVTNSEASHLLTAMSVLYMLLLVQSVRRSESSFIRTVRLKLRATSLAASLDREHSLAKASAERLFLLANHDSLTGLANRAAFSTHLAEMIETSRAEQASFGLLLLDLDHFKSVNDTLGHSAGDEVLQETARRLVSALVEEDVMVARLGGDEFAILHCGTRAGAARGFEPHKTELVAARLIDAVSGILEIGDHPVSIGLSIGVAMFPADGTTTESLLAKADLALYAAKDGGRQNWRRFDTVLLSEATQARDVERDLPIAIAEGKLQAFFQPQVALRDGRVAGLETLLRWNHPVHGWVSPPVIVAAARRIRKSEALTEFVLGAACRQIGRLNEFGFTNVLVAFNVSPFELDEYDLPALVRHALDRNGVDPSRLEVEITEEGLVRSAKALATLEALSAMGVRLAIDDFGTGCSALAYLRNMRVDRIKIDRSFVTGLSKSAGDSILVQAILGLGHSFSVEVLAEGVETPDEMQLLKGFGCEFVQGYHIARPLCEIDLHAWLANERAGARRVSTTMQESSASTADVMPRFQVAAA